jgi:HSP20 family protein
MSLRRWEPFAGLARLREDMDRWFDEFWPAGLGREAAALRVPAVDLMETDEEVVLKAELPGVDKKDLSVEVLRDSVSIKGETLAEKEAKEGGYCRRERRWGSFERVVPLPAEVKSAQAKATLKDGLLEVRLPKSEVAKAEQPTKVTVEGAK